MKEREKFGSRLGFILVSAGCAVGLGNVWKFPYICGLYGGGAFLAIYLLFLVIIGFPLLVCEFAVGRGSGYGISLAFDKMEPKGTKWHHFKWVGMIGNYLLMMFYTMVAGWMMHYAYIHLTGKMEGLDKSGVKETFDNMLSSAPTMTFWMIAAVVISFGVCLLGLQNGIEKVTKVMMSVLIVLMVILAVHSITLDGALAGVKYYLVPDFEAVKEHGVGTVVFAALTHAFFTLSIGIGSMEIFGSYLKKDRTLAGEAASVVCVDTFVAFTAGLIIIPACFAYGVEPDAGPSLLFVTLPNVFNNMTGGKIWGCAFFIFMVFAAISTVIAVFENILSFYMDMLGWERKKAVIFNFFLIIVLSMPAVLGYNLWSGFAPLGKGTTIMDLEDFIVSNNALPLGGLFFLFFCVRKNGWGWDNFRAEANTGEGKKLPNWIRYYMSYILPLIIVGVYLKGYYDFFRERSLPVLIGWMTFAILLVVLVIGLSHYSPRKAERVDKELE